MFSNLSAGALGLSIDHPRAIALAVEYGFGGVDPDPGYFSSLGGAAAVAEHGEAVRAQGLQWGLAGLSVPLTAPAAEFVSGLERLRTEAELLCAAGVGSVGTWLRPMDDELPYRANWTLHVSRLQLVADVLADHGLRLGLEYVGPKTFWSTERFPFVHTSTETLELISAAGRANVGLILDSYHWYTAGESDEDLIGLSDADLVGVDLNDAPTGRTRDEQLDQDRRLPGATGVIDLAGFMDGVRAAGFTGPVKAEPFMPSLASLPEGELLADVSARLSSAIG